MKKTFLKIIFISIISILGFNLLCMPVTYADDVCSADVADEVKRAAGCEQTKELDDSVQAIINSIILVVGVVAVIFVLIGGINYMTSAGDPGKLEKAKKTILYAVIGIFICALAFAITNWAILVANKATR